MIEDVVVAFEDSVREPVVAHILPNVLDWIELWRFGGQGDERHVFGHLQLRGDVPPGLVDEQNGVGAGFDGERDFLEMQRHRLGVAKGHDETGRLAERRTNGPEYQIPKNLTRPLDFPKVPGSDSEMSRRIRHGDAYFVTRRF